MHTSSAHLLPRIIVDLQSFFFNMVHVLFTPALYRRYSHDKVQLKESTQYYQDDSHTMKKKQSKKKVQVEKRERAMIEGIIEGSPDCIGVVVVRLECGCRKMAAISKEGDPASKIIMYRDQAESICDKCKEDNGSFMRISESFIHWIEPAPDDEKQKEISLKVLGSATSH